MNDLKAKLHNVRSRVDSACEKAGRKPSEITILAVSKRHPAALVRQLHKLGLSAFGENYMHEAIEKQAQLADLDLEWHFIGPVQSNKTRQLAQHFDWVQSADREKILRRLSAQRKAGVLPESLEELVHFALGLPNLRLRGLMAIPRLGSAEHDPTDSYRRMRDLFLSLIDTGILLDTLSMGMSADLENAIMMGSTMLRIGTDLFGPRP
jgi:hypothetical protein